MNAYLSLLPVVLGLSFSNVVFADEAPAEPGRPGPLATPEHEAPTQPKPAAQVKSKAMIVVGSIMSGLGAAGLIGGGALFARAAADGCGAEESCDIDSSATEFFGTILMVAGGVHTAVGIPLIAVGAQTSGETSDSAARASLELGATGATFSFSF